MRLVERDASQLLARGRGHDHDVAPWPGEAIASRRSEHASWLWARALRSMDNSSDTWPSRATRGPLQPRKIEAGTPRPRGRRRKRRQPEVREDGRNERARRAALHRGSCARVAILREGQVITGESASPRPGPPRRARSARRFAKAKELGHVLLHDLALGPGEYIGARIIPVGFLVAPSTACSSAVQLGPTYRDRLLSFRFTVDKHAIHDPGRIIG